MSAQSPATTERRAQIDTLLVKFKEHVQSAEEVLNDKEGKKWSENNSFKLSKGDINTVLEPVKDVATILDVACEIHPTLKLLATLFKAVVKLETDQKDNQKQVLTLCYAMCGMLVVLVELLDYDQERMHRYLEPYLGDMVEIVSSCGTLCDQYNKSTRLSRLKDAMDYAEQFRKNLKRIDRMKQDLNLLIAQHTAVTSDRVIVKVEEISSDLTHLTEFMERKTPREQEAHAIVQEYGGIEELLKILQLSCIQDNYGADDCDSSEVDEPIEGTQKSRDKQAGRQDPDLGTSCGSDQDLIGTNTSVQDIVSILTRRGCRDLTSSIDLPSCGARPAAGGGFCDVYRGKLNDGTSIAIKLLRSFEDSSGDDATRKISKRAGRELYHWSKLKHRNVVSLKGLAIFRDSLSMISKWMENGDLTSYIGKNPRIDRIKICTDVALGLCYIHANEMVHGDLKSANVLVSAQGVAMISDFGSTRLRNLTLAFSATGSSGTSLRWTAPELLGEDSPGVNKKTDVYAYGMTALEIITGKIPYEGHGDTQVLHFVLLAGRLPSRPDTEISNELWELLNSCWDRDPSRRPDMQRIANLLCRPGCTPNNKQKLHVASPSPRTANRNTESWRLQRPELINQAKHHANGSPISGRLAPETLDARHDDAKGSEPEEDTVAGIDDKNEGTIMSYDKRDNADEYATDGDHSEGYETAEESPTNSPHSTEGGAELGPSEFLHLSPLRHSRTHKPASSGEALRSFREQEIPGI